MRYDRQAYILRNVIRDIGLNGVRDIFFIAGGACTSVFSRKGINDVDIFFKTQEDFDNVKIVLNNNDRSTLKFTTDNAESYEVAIESESSERVMRVQLIKKMFGSPKEIISQFDFTICMCAYLPNEDAFIMDESFLLHVADKTLCFNPDSEYPLSSLYRVVKFLRRDFKISALELLKMSLCINNLGLKTYEDVKKQLEGIDTYLLKDMTDYLVEHSSKKFDFKEFMAYADKYLAKFYGDEDAS